MNTTKKSTLWNRYGRDVTVIPSYGNTRYLIIMATGTAWGIPYRVNGDCVQDAIDFIVDSGKLPGGCFADEETTAAYWDEDHEDHDYAVDFFTPAGNAGELIYSDCYVVEERQNPPHRYNCG